MGGISKGITDGMKMQDERKAKLLDSMMQQQGLEKNALLLKQAREEDTKKLAGSEMNNLITEADLTGDMTKINGVLQQMQAPFRFSDRIGKDGTVNILSSTGDVLDTRTKGAAFNAIYEPVAGKRHPVYEKEVEQTNEEYKLNTKLTEINARTAGQVKVKQTAPGVAPSEAAYKYATADKNVQDAEMTAAEVAHLKKTGQLPGREKVDETGGGKSGGEPAGKKRLGLQWQKK